MAVPLSRSGVRAASLMLALTLAFLDLGAAEKPVADISNAGLEFAPAGGVFTQAVSLGITTKEPGDVVRYTLDGSEPTEKSPAFVNAIELRNSTLVRAGVFGADKRGSTVVAQTYTVLDEDAQKFTSNLPLVIINTFGAAIEHTTKKRAAIRFIDAAGGRASLLSPADFDGSGDIWYRGKSSLRYFKRSYGFKVRDDLNRSRSVSILGFPEDSDWILYGPYPDKTLLRDVLAYELSNQMGRCASRTRFVEVFAKEGGGRLSLRDYMGVFVLEEKVKRADNRVNIRKLGTNDNAEPKITGGYLFKKDHLDEPEDVEPTWDGRPNFRGGNAGLSYGFPTGPGGFPADPHGFLPPNGGSRENAIGWETSRNAQTAASQQPQAGNSQVGELRSFLGGGNVQPPPSARGQGMGLDPNQRSRRGLREPIMVWDANRRSADNGRSFEEAFYTGQRNEFIYVDPEANALTREQKSWLLNYLNSFERVLYGPNFLDPTNGYAAFIEADSFIDHHLLVELTKNIDGLRFSTYYSKDRGGKLKMEPIWDWNLSFGNANGKQGQLAEYWYWPQLDDGQYSWFRRLFDDPDFGQRYVDRYAELRAGVFSLSNLNARIDRHVVELGEAQVRNFKRWPILGRRVWPNTFVGNSYAEEIGYMKDFIRRRLDWIDRQFVAAPSVAVAAPAAGSSGVIALSAAAGKIYYTLDGTDPRLPGGGIAPSAQLAAAPFKLPAGAKLLARAQHDRRWSAPTFREAGMNAIP